MTEADAQPARIIRSATDRAKAAQGYLSAAERDGCRNCMHAQRQGGHPYGYELRCTLGEFGTWPNAWCQRHRRGVAA